MDLICAWALDMIMMMIMTVMMTAIMIIMIQFKRWIWKVYVHSLSFSEVLYLVIWVHWFNRIVNINFLLLCKFLFYDVQWCIPLFFITILHSCITTLYFPSISHVLKFNFSPTINSIWRVVSFACSTALSLMCFHCSLSRNCQCRAQTHRRTGFHF